MKQVWQLIGQITFWLAWPLLFVYLRLTQRTRVLVIVDNEILVVKGWLGTGHWSLPGGGKHRGESAVQTTLRELREETGVLLQAEQLHTLPASNVRQYGLTMKLSCFYAVLNSKPLTTRQPGEIIAVRWLPLDQLKSFEVGNEIMQMVGSWQSSTSLI